MGIFLGLLAGLGLLLVLQSGQPRRPKCANPEGWQARTRDLLAQAGVEGVTPRQLVAASVGLGLVVGLVLLVLSQTWPLALAFALFAGFAPRGLVRARRRKRVGELREVWPEVVDNLASAVRAGLSLPEALASLGGRGPVQLRRPFRRFGEDYRATGSFNACIDRLEDALADPVADRVCESLRMAREVGGTDLGRLLRTLSRFLREDARTRAELETRQGWAINAARLALAAPWAVLLLLATQSSTVTAYNSTVGVIVLAIGGGVSLIAYRVMVRIGRLPEELRVFR